MSTRIVGPKSRVAKFQKPAPEQRQVRLDILQNQQTDLNGDLADTILVCNGGVIHIHGFLLQSASPFIQKAMLSQGEDYPHTREILLPDFSVKEITNMLNLVYKGYVELKTRKDFQTLKSTLDFFQITNVNLNCKDQWDRIRGDLKFQELNRIPQDIFEVEAEAAEVNESDNSSDIVPLESSPPPPVVVAAVVKAKKIQTETVVRRSTRVVKPVVKNPSDAYGGDDDDSEEFIASESPGESSSSEESAGEEETQARTTRSRGRGRDKKAKPALRLPSTPIKSTKSSSSGTTKSTAPSSGGKSSGSGITTVKVSTNPTPTKRTESETDTEDERWSKPNFKDLKWFSRESRRCQSCNKTYDKPADASICITSHKRLRCYFCFRVYSTTDKLFKHFAKRHKQAGRDNTLVCPYCDQAVPYKSVSCHVISVHLKNKPEGKSKNKDRDRSASKTPNTPTRSTSSSSSSKRPLMSSAEGPPPKKTKSTGIEEAKKGKQLKLTDMKKKNVAAPGSSYKQAKLKVEDFNFTLMKTTLTGKVLVWNLHKKRPLSAS